MTLSDEDIDRIAAGLIDASLPRGEWTHAAHLAAALWLLRYRGQDAFGAMPGLIRRYNEACGTPNTDSSGYHETITQASMRMVAWFIAQRDEDALSVILQDILASPFGRPDWLLDYWSRDNLFSPEARRAWRAPDICALPFAI